MLKKSFKIVLFSFLCCVIVTAVWAQEFRFTSTADMTNHDGFSDVLNQIKNLVGNEGAFHIIPGDFDWDSTPDMLKAAFGNDVIWIPAIGNHDGDDKSQVKNHNQTLPLILIGVQEAVTYVPPSPSITIMPTSSSWMCTAQIAAAISIMRCTPGCLMIYMLPNNQLSSS